MNAYQLMAHLSGLGVKLRLQDGKLNVKAKPGVINEEIKTLIGNHREQLVSILGEGPNNNGIDPVAVKPYYKLSSAQKRMFFLAKLNPDSIAYNMPQVVDMSGQVDQERLIRAFEQLVDRHEILRTSFGIMDHEPFQIVHEAVSANVAVFQSDENGVDRIVQDFIRPFDFSDDSLIRLGIIMVDGRRCTLMVDMHHIVSDGFSHDILIRELMAFYNESPLEHLRIQYKDFAEWQQGNSLERDRHFWVKAFEDYTETPELPIDFPRSSDGGMESDHVSVKLDTTECEQLKTICEATNSTPFNALMSICAVWLSRLSYQDSVVIGTPAAGRNHPDLEALVGMFVNTLPLKFSVDQKQNFRDFLLASRDDVVACFDHQNYPYENLVEELKLQRDPSRNPLFDVMFSFQNLEQTELELPEVQVRGRSTGPSLAKFDLTISAEARRDLVQLTFEYPRKLFKRETIERLSMYFLRVASQVLSSPDEALLNIDILGDEREKLLRDFNQTEVSLQRDPNFIQVFNCNAHRFMDRTAIVCGDEKVTYESLVEGATGISSGLTYLGVGAGDVVCYISDKSPCMIMGLLGILSSGATFLPIDPAYPDERIRFILEDSKCALLLTNGYDATALEFKGKTADINDFNEAIASPFIPANKNGEAAYVIYTSGSTGQPKGVMVGHRALLNLCQWHNRQFEVSKEDKAAKYAGFGFDASIWEIFPYLLIGSEIHILKEELRLDVSKINAYYERNHITIGFLPTQVFEQFIKLENQSLRILLTGGDALKSLQPTRYLVVNNYGPTENTVVTTSESLSDGPITIGKPVDNVQIYVLDEHNRLQPIGVPGELCISGASLALGYLNNDELTEERFIPNPFEPGERIYKTGDLTKWLPDGRVAFLGRLDDQVKIRGFRIELGEVEKSILEHPWVTEGTVVAKDNEEGDKQLIAYYVATQEPVDLRTHLRKFLPDYMVPSVFVPIENLPLTANGKIDKRALPEVSFDDSRAHVSPTSESEQQLVDIWSEILKKEPNQISVTDNFFHIGGHSLKAASLVNKIHEVFQVMLPLKEVFRNADIQSLAVKIDEEKATAYVPIKPVDARDYYGLSAAQLRMYVLYEMDKSAVAYNVPQIIRLGRVDPKHLEDAFCKLIDRHEILRTTFHQIDGRVCQKVHDQMDFHLELVKVQQSELSAAIGQLVKPFDLSNGPIFRACLIQENEGVNYLFFDTHHIITDGVSNEILKREFLALLKGEPMSEVKLHYKDYAAWQQLPDQKLAQDAQKAFWLAQFEERPGALELPLDFKRPDIWNAEGKDFVFGLSKETNDGLLKLASDHSITPYSVLLTVFGVLLSKLSASKEIVIGTPVSGRSHADLSEMIGMFVNTLPLKLSVGNRETALEALKSAHDYVLNCLDHQTYQYEDLVEDLKVRRDLSRNTLFDVMFAYEEVAGEKSQMGTGELEIVNGNWSTAKFDLTLNAQLIGDQFFFDFNYATSLFAEDTIEKWSAYLTRIVQQIVNDPNTTIGDIVLIDELERNQLLTGSNATNFSVPNQNVIECFEEVCDQYPENTALLFEDEHLTYRELNQRANKLSRYLLREKIHPGDIVGFRMGRSMDMIISILAILKAGCTYLPLDPDQPEIRLSNILEDAEVKAILTDDPERDAPLNKLCTVMDFANAIQKADDYADHDLNLGTDKDTVVYVLFTSGTTGRPKGVEISHHSLLNLALTQSAYFGISEQDRILQFSSIVFDASMEQIWMSLLSAAQLVLIPKTYLVNNHLFNQYLTKQAVTHLHATPSYLETIELEDQKSLKRVIAGGEVCKTSLAEKFTGKFDFYNEYGPTETTITALVKQVGKKDLNDAVVSIGHPVANTQIYILDESMKLVPKGVCGELYIGGSGVANGYISDPQKTQASFVDNPFGTGKLYRSGDLAKWTREGEVAYMGRLDDQVKIRGFRIELSEIENVMTIHPRVQAAVAIVSGDQLLGYYQSVQPVEELTDFIREYLPDYMVPNNLVHMEKFKLGPTGKIDKSDLSIPEMKAPVKLSPKNDIEEKLQSIWSEVLELSPDQIGAEANFFQIGGHSLSAMKLSNVIHDQFGIECLLTDIFQQQNLIKMSELISAKLREKETNISNDSVKKESIQDQVITLNDVQSEDRIFWIHDGSGDALSYLEISRHLNFLSSYGLQSQTLEYLHPVNTSVETLAQQYVDKILKVQPVGPYLIGGWSFGGLIGLRIVAELEARGHKVAQLVMIDSVPSDRSTMELADFDLSSERAFLKKLMPDLSVSKVDSLAALWSEVCEMVSGTPEFIETLRQMIRYPLMNKKTMDAHSLLTYYNTNRSLSRSLAHFQPEFQVNAPAIIFQAQETDFDGREMQQFFRTEIDFQKLPGDHFSVIHGESSKQIAKRIERALQVLA